MLENQRRINLRYVHIVKPLRYKRGLRFFDFDLFQLEENHKDEKESKKRGVADMDEEEEEDEEEDEHDDYAKNLVEGPVLEDESDSDFDVI